MTPHPIVSHDAWVAARKEHLKKEKEFTRLRDDLSRQRRELPWERVEKEYVFDGPNGRETLADLFASRSQLIVYHFMFTPGWKEGCQGCSFLSDHIDGARVHLEHHDVSLVVVSRAPLADLERFKQRMGWGFKWVSSGDGDFNYDYHVSFRKEDLAKGEVLYNYEMTKGGMEDLPGASVFVKDERGAIFHTYSSYSRGGDILIGTYNYLDLTPKGRNENGPHHNMGDWMRHHDRYDAAATDATGPEAQIRAVIDDWAGALRGKDADGVVAHHAPGAVLFTLAPPLQHTGSAADGRKGLKEWFATWRGPLGYDIRDLRVSVGDGVAFAHSLNHMTGAKTTGENVDLWFRDTMCFRRISGEWKITHEHESVPFYMDGSVRAATDLEP
jgi:predicted dithiol-disulfide oxidoreductase (DUF899 family)/ketosteroid isomerase-like protein